MKTTITAALIGAFVGAALTLSVTSQSAKLSDPIVQPTQQEVYRAIDDLRFEVDLLKKDVGSLDIRVDTLNRVLDREIQRQRP